MHLFQSVLLPDGTPDVHLRTARGGQKLRNIMLDANMELYGPYVSYICHAINNSCPLFMLLKECLYMHIAYTSFVFGYIVMSCINWQSRPLLNCAGGGTCGTCIVEVIFLTLILPLYLL